MLDLFPPSNLYLQHLELFCVNMQTFNSNVDSPLASATTDESQIPQVDLSQFSNIGTVTVTSHGNSPLGSATTDEPQIPRVDLAECFETIRNIVSYRRRQLVEERANIIQSNTSHSIFSSAIWRLPTEILSQIFLYCLPEDQYLSLRTSTEAPILLTQICRRWREVALDLPRLWCRLQLEAEPWRWMDLDRRALLYKSWIKRSRGYPLSLKLQCGGTDWRELRSLLQPHVQQISTLFLDFGDCFGPFTFDDFHALKELTIHHHSFDSHHDNPWRYIANRSLLKLPVNLRKIDMGCRPFDRRRLDRFTDPSWTRLTHIKIRLEGLDAFTRMLRLCPNLTSLQILGEFKLIRNLEPVTHTNLQSLSIFWNIQEPRKDVGLFKVITLPNLRTIEAANDGPWPHEDFMEFLTRSKCHLETLFLYYADKAPQWKEYIGLIPTVKFISSDSFLMKMNQKNLPISSLL